MRIFVFPVSGGAFPAQLGMISEYYKSMENIYTEQNTGEEKEKDLFGSVSEEYVSPKPDIVMGSSGGNVAAYLGLASGWKKENMLEISNSLHTGIFAQSWWPNYLNFMPSWLIGHFKGTCYTNGTGSDEIFKKLFSTDTITETEMWTGTLNRGTKKGQFFCNLKQEDCIIQPIPEEASYLSLFSRECMPLKYLNGDIDLISQVTMASASIPALVPDKVIGGEKYVDGGTLFASPLSALQDQLADIMDQHPFDKFHLNYISSYDLRNSNSYEYRNLYENGTQAIADLVRSICIADHKSAIELLRSGTTHLNYTEVEGSQENLQKVEEIRNLSSKSVLEMCPTKNRALDLMNFKGSDVQNLIESVSEPGNYRLRLWWTGKVPQDIANGLPLYNSINASQVLRHI